MESAFVRLGRIFDAVLPRCRDRADHPLGCEVTARWKAIGNRESRSSTARSPICPMWIDDGNSFSHRLLRRFVPSQIPRV